MLKISHFSREIPQKMLETMLKNPKKMLRNLQEIPQQNAEKIPQAVSPGARFVVRRRKVHELLGTAALREDGHRPLGVRALEAGDGRVEKTPSFQWWFYGN